MQLVLRPKAMWLCVQGGCDWLTAFGTDGKAEATFKKQLAEQQLSDAAAVTAKALYKLKGVGPMEACLIANKFGSLGALMAHFMRASSKAAACR